MNSLGRTIAAAALGAAGVLTLMSVAGAQEAPTTTEPPAAEAPATDDDRNCPEKDASGGDSSGDSSADGTNIRFRRL